MNKLYLYLSLVVMILLTGCARFTGRCEELWFKALPWADCPYCEHNRRPDYQRTERENIGDNYVRVTRSYKWVDIEKNPIDDRDVDKVIRDFKEYLRNRGVDDK